MVDQATSVECKKYTRRATAYINPTFEKGPELFLTVDALERTTVEQTQKVNRTGEQFIDDVTVRVTTSNGCPAEVKEPNSGSDVIRGLVCLQVGQHCFEGIQTFLLNRKKTIWNVFCVLLIVAYFVYFGYSISYEFGSEASMRLVWVTSTVVGCFLINLLHNRFGIFIKERLVTPLDVFVLRHWTLFKICFCGLVLLLITLYIILAVAIPEPSNLISLGGLCVYVLLMFLFSAHKKRIAWRTVLWGLGLQFVFALLILRTRAGLGAFKWVGDRVAEFMSFTDAGSLFIFGPSYANHFFVMKILPVVIFFSSAISVLYYLGAMQAVISRLAWVMQRTMGSTAAESVNAAGNIFIGQTEAPLLIRPFIDKMTRSELHAVMVGGYATIAGSVMATYIMMGVPANHLISASIMAAPCALGISKLCYPETEESLTTADSITKLEGRSAAAAPPGVKFDVSAPTNSCAILQ